MKDSTGYHAMFRFLEERYMRLRSDDLGTLLGELALTADGRPFDPAITEEWNKAVEAVQQESGVNTFQQHRRAG